VATTKAKVDSSNAAASASDANAGSNTTHVAGSNKLKVAGAEDSTSVETPSGTNVVDAPSHSHHLGNETAPLNSSSPPSSSFSSQMPMALNPDLSSQEYKLHQFFSMYRPMLLLSQPTSSLFESHEHPFPPWAVTMDVSDRAPPPPPTRLGTLDDPQESSAEADADAARQLARTLAVNRVGSVISWEQTLARLGLNEEDVDGKAALAKERATIRADSTKRKRRRKMKKHKLKKRRRLQRASRANS